MKKIALLYHEVVDDFKESGFQNNDNLAYMHTTEIFEKHISIYKNFIQNQNSTNTNKYLFTFDDGGISNLRSAKILEKNDIRAYYFITTKFIDTKGFLSKEDIINIHKNGHTIGSHSHTHPMIFRTLPKNQMINEWKKSKNILEDILGEEVLSCSIPGGDADEKTYETAKEVGYKHIFDSEPIVTHRKLDTLEIIGRLSIKASVSDQEFLEILQLKNLSSLQRKRKIKGMIKKMIFPIHQYMQNKKNE